MFMKRAFGLLLLLWGIIVGLPANDSGIRFHNMSIEHGLSQSLVSSMVEDDKGFLWFATQEGLNRYDGYEFKKYYAGTGDKHLLKNWTSYLYKDQAGQIWIYYQGGGIDRLDPRTETFYKYSNRPLGEEGNISSVDFRVPHMVEYGVFYEDNEGILWIGTSNGVNRYNRETDRFETLMYESDSKDTPNNNSIVTVKGDNKGNLWIGTYNGLFRYNKQNKTYKHFLPEPGNPNALQDSVVTYIHVSDSNVVWVGTQHNGIYIIENAYSEDYQISNQLTQTSSSNFDPVVYNIFKTSKGSLYVGTINGLYYYENDKAVSEGLLIPVTREVRINMIVEDYKGFIWAISRNDDRIFRIGPDSPHNVDVVLPKPSDKYGYGGQSIISLDLSKTGLLWLGTEKGGIYKVDIYAKEFRRITGNQNESIHLSNPEVYSIYEDEDKNLYVGTHDQLNIINLNNGDTDKYGGPYRTIAGVNYEYSNKLAAGLIGTIVPDETGKIWMGAFDYKVSLFDPESKVFLNFHHNDTDPGAFRIWSIRDILVSSDNVAYFGGTNNGLAKLLPDGKSFMHYPVKTTDNTGTSDSWINTMIEDSRGDIWVGTLSRGLNKFDPASETFEYFFHDPGDPTSINDNNIRCILEPQIFGDEILWVGTDRGLNMFDRKNRVFYNFQDKNDLLTAIVLGILEDNKGRLWLSTNRGIVYYDPITETSRTFTEADGLLDTEFNEGAYFKNKDGILYFGGPSGITYFHPDDIDLNPYQSEVVVTNLNIFNEPVNSGDTINKNFILTTSISYVDEVILSHKEKIFSLEFSSLHMVSPGKIRYKYKLEGFEDSWNEVDASQRIASYTNIPHGEYIFKLLSSNSDGVWSNSPLELKVRILPPFWKTKWFLILFSLTLLLLIYLFIQIRLKVLREQKEELQKKVEKRTRQLSDANEQLKNKQDEIVSQSEKISYQNEDLSKKNQLLENQKKEIQVISEKLHESDQMKLRFFTNISHEFKTPLTLIMGPTEKLLEQDDYSNSGAIKENLRLMHKNEKRLFRLINQLLEIRRIETSNLSLSTQRADIIWFAFEIFELFRPFSRSRDIEFQFNPDMESCQMLFDGDKIEKILYNLLSNAFKYAPVGGRVSLTILTQSEKKDMLVIKVSDNGPGIPEKHLEHIFDRFYQISKKSDSAQISSGIGLSLCRDLVKAHKGEIEVMSSSERGTTFSITIPINHPDLLASEKEKEESGVNYQFDYLKSMMDNPDFSDSSDGYTESVERETENKILLVEDNKEMLDFLYKELRNDYEIIKAANGIQGLSLAQEHIPDLVISDIMMPEMDGVTLCQKLKTNQLTSHVPVFLLTAKSEMESQISGLKSQADDYIIKPFSPQALRLKIFNVLKSREQLAEKFTKELDAIPSNININEIDQGFLEKFVSYVEENMDDSELSGDRIAQELAISKGNLYKKLKSLSGMTVNTYIRTIRLKTAAKILKKGKYNISEVAYSVGFNNPRYFSICFSELFKLSPKEYMKKELNKN